MLPTVPNSSSVPESDTGSRWAARPGQEDETEWPLCRLGAGIEGTLSQGVRAAKCADLPCPVVGGGAGLHADETGRQCLEEGQHLVAAKLPVDQDPTLGIDAMDLKEGLGQIQPDGRNFL